MSKTLQLLRHAKSDWDNPALEDAARPLADRGRSDIALVSEHMREKLAIEPPRFVHCSPALRTRETLAGIVDALAEDAMIEFDPRIYGGGAKALWEIARETDPAQESLLLIGHNPGMQNFAVELAGGGDGAGELAVKYPTAALATFRIERPWSELIAGSGELVSFVRPRDLR